jgi:uncharacterized protein (TIGR03435 family)
MKKIFLLVAALALAACGGKPADEKPAQRPDTVKVGELAPQIKLEKIVSGGPAVINGWEDLKGKAVVMEFWGTYCDPCLENIPHLNALADKFKDKPVVFLSISRETEKDVRDFLKEHELKGIVAADAPMAYKNYRVMGIPHTVLVDKDSRVVAVTYPADVNEGTIENLLAGKGAAEAAPEAPAAGAKAPGGDASAESYFSVTPSINGRVMRTSRGRLETDGYTLAENIEKLVEPARPVEYKGVDKALLAKKYAMTVKVPEHRAGGVALRDLGVAGLSSAFPLRIVTAMKERKVYLIKTGTAFPGALKEESGRGSSVSFGTTKSGKKMEWNFDAKLSTIAGLADTLGEWTKTPVIDETGLGMKGYSFSVRFPSLDLAGLQSGLAPLGLKVEETSRVVEIAEVTAKK